MLLALWWTCSSALAEPTPQARAGIASDLQALRAAVPGIGLRPARPVDAEWLAPLAQTAGLPLREARCTAVLQASVDRWSWRLEGDCPDVLPEAQRPGEVRAGVLMASLGAQAATLMLVAGLTERWEREICALDACRISPTLGVGLPAMTASALAVGTLAAPRGTKGDVLRAGIGATAAGALLVTAAVDTNAPDPWVLASAGFLVLAPPVHMAAVAGQQSQVALVPRPGGLTLQGRF